MNHIEQAYERGEKIRARNWGKNFWIQKYTDVLAISSKGKTYPKSNFIIVTFPDFWEIYHEDKSKIKAENIKAQIQNNINKIQELLKQL